MDRLEAMSLFVAAIEEGSLAAAARRHGRSPAAATRAIALLEHNAGETLLLRSTRSLSLTAAGDRHFLIWREVLAKLQEIEPEAAGAALQGSITVTAPELFGRLKVMPLLETFLAEHSQVAVRVQLLNRIVNLTGEGVDLAVRLAPLRDSNLTAVKLGEVRTLLCAAPDYVARVGSPTEVGDLDRHDCIGLNAESDSELWPFRVGPAQASRIRSVRVSTRLSVSNAAAAIDAALRGHGVICARSYQVAEHIVAGRLIRLLPEVEPPPVPAYVVFQSDRAKRGAIRVLIDHLVPALRSEFAQIEAMVPSQIRQA